MIESNRRSGPGEESSFGAVLGQGVPAAFLRVRRTAILGAGPPHLDDRQELALLEKPVSERLELPVQHRDRFGPVQLFQPLPRPASPAGRRA